MDGSTEVTVLCRVHRNEKAMGRENKYLGCGRTFDDPQGGIHVQRMNEKRGRRGMGGRERRGRNEGDLREYEWDEDK